MFLRDSMNWINRQPDNNENEDTRSLVLRFFKEQLDLTVSSDHIDRAHRLGPYDKDSKSGRSIVVKFTHYDACHTVFSARKKLTKTGYFINNHLTSTHARLMFVAHLYKKKNLVNQHLVIRG